MAQQFPSGLMNALASSVRMTVLTGAGISAESGVPTFREAQTGLCLGALQSPGAGNCTGLSEGP